MRTIPGKFADWLLRQSTETVLLVVLCGSIGYAAFSGIPMVRSWLREDLREINAAHSANVDKVIQAWDGHMDNTLKEFHADQERDQKLLEELLRGRAIVKQPQPQPQGPLVNQ